MLVIVFLVLSLGIGALRHDQEVSPVSSLHPSLITINQATQGFLAIEKLIFLDIDGYYFVDEPKSRPTNLDAYSIVDTENFISQKNVVGDPKAVALQKTMAKNSIFQANGATDKNTFVLPGILIDTEHVLDKCVDVLKAASQYVSSKGMCYPAANFTGGTKPWTNIRKITSEGGGRCFTGKCNYSLNDTDISFSGVASNPWNGASMSFKDRSAFNSTTTVFGLVCGLEASGQRDFLSMLQDQKSKFSNFMHYGTSSFRLFAGDEGYKYLENRLTTNAETTLEVSVFDPNKNKSVSQYILNFDGLKIGDGLPDGVVFNSQQSCENTKAFLESNGETVPEDFPHQLMRLFKLELKSGAIKEVFGVDRIEER